MPLDEKTSVLPVMRASNSLAVSGISAFATDVVRAKQRRASRRMDEVWHGCEEIGQR